jgi:MHS family proline/betaine transporter-like MFS transporter
MKQNPIKILFASITGTSLEFYNFMLYAVFMEAIGQEFFPTHNQMQSILFGSLGFFAAFFARPFGATLFGYIGDKYGRRLALILSISLMGLPTLIIGILPSYASWGIAASISLIVCRLVQGLCTGGEYNGSAIFALEHLGKKYPGFFGAMITAASVSGALLANTVGIYLKQPGMPEWGWRAAFAMGALVSLVGLYIRLQTSESPEFEKLMKNKKVNKSPLIDAITRHWPSSLTTIITGTLNGILAYTLYKFLSIYMVRWMGYSETDALKFTNFGIMVYICSAPIMGYIMDKMGSEQLYMKWACCFIIAGSLPLFYLFQCPNLMTTYIGEALIGLMVASIAGPEHAFIQKLFPVRDRYSGVAFNYCVGMGIGGGAMPWIQVYLVEVTHNLDLSNCMVNVPTFALYIPGVTIIVVALLAFWAIRHISRTYLAVQEEDNADLA